MTMKKPNAIRPSAVSSQRTTNIGFGLCNPYRYRSAASTVFHIERRREDVRRNRRTNKRTAAAIFGAVAVERKGRINRKLP